jgi:hypothetical protein
LVYKPIFAGVNGMKWSSRLVCWCFCWLLCVYLVSPSTAYATDGRTLVFDLLRKGKKVGSHSIRFAQSKDILTVDIAISIKGKVLFIPFTYIHSNRETWRGSVLQSLDSKTLVNDKQFLLSVRPVNGGYDIAVNGKDGRVEGDIKTTSYWHPATSSQSRLLNSQTGKILQLLPTTSANVQAPTVTGGNIAAKETRMTDGKKFNANVAYDSQSCLIGLNFKPPFDGTPIVYQLVARPTAKTAPDLLANPLIAKCLAAG